MYSFIFVKMGGKKERSKKEVFNIDEVSEEEVLKKIVLEEEQDEDTKAFHRYWVKGVLREMGITNIDIDEIAYSIFKCWCNGSTLSIMLNFDSSKFAKIWVEQNKIRNQRHIHNAHTIN
jgi:hypothetical protein